MSPSTTSVCSAILSGAIAPWRPARIVRFDLFPERFMRNAAPLPKALAGGFQDRLQVWRVTHEQAFEITLALRAEQCCDRFAATGHDDGALPGGLHLFSKICSDFVLRGNFHNSTFSPPTFCTNPKRKRGLDGAPRRCVGVRIYRCPARRGRIQPLSPDRFRRSDSGCCRAPPTSSRGRCRTCSLDFAWPMP